MRVRPQFEKHLLDLLRHGPAVQTSAAERLSQLCEQQRQAKPLAAWRTFWALTLHFFEDLRSDPTRRLEDPEITAVSHVLSGLMLHTRVQAHDMPFEDSLQVINHLLFLEQADVVSQRLVSLLTEWSASPELAMAVQVQGQAQSMAQLAQDVALTAVHQVADSLTQQLAGLSPKPSGEDIQVSLSGAEEVSRLLQHFAVGHVHKPKAAVLAALRG